MTKRNKIIAIDGHSSTGKSTLAKVLAKRLGYAYIDSGAMFRALTFYGIKNGTINSLEKTIDKTAFINSIQSELISFKKDKSTKEFQICLNGQNIAAEIRLPNVSNMVSQVSELPQVRQKLLDLQRKIATDISVVMDGRDIGSTVFPNAQLKLFITASLEVRAQRRFLELQSKNIKTTLADVTKNLRERDRIDSQRELSPLQKASDAILIDNTTLSIENQLQLIEKMIVQKCL